MGISRKKKRLPGAEYKALWKVLGGAKSCENETSFSCACVICGKRYAVFVCEREGGHVDCFCRKCGATKEQILAEIGLDTSKYEVEAIEERELKKSMAAMDVLGANRCTACEHYVREEVGYNRKIYGCKVRNLYRMDELWEAPESDEPCKMYQADRNKLLKGAANLDATIEAYARVLEEFKQRRALLAQLLNET
ncbi:MAG: hypothetical protein IKJ11_10875 [Clostridia bacterium]|nr:hypothetical protein [Clostridia bacterium]